VSYAGHINRHISPLIGSIPVSSLRPTDVRRLISQLANSDLSPSTVRRIHSTLHSALAQGVRERTLVDNPAHGVTLPKPEQRLIEAMTENDADAIRGAVRGTFLETLVELLLGSGLRLGEALGLDQGDVTGRVVMVHRTKGRKRAVSISQDAADALSAHISMLPVRGPHEPVFWGPRSGQRLRGSTVSHSFPKMLLDAGLARLNPHGTRHGVASMMLAQGTPMKVVSVQLGHRSITTTDAYYAHISPEHLDDAVQGLNRRKT
jgi:site-specific recombinase XerD